MKTENNRLLNILKAIGITFIIFTIGIVVATIIQLLTKMPDWLYILLLIGWFFSFIAYGVWRNLYGKS